MYARFYNFSKKRNSTKRPDVESIEFNVTLKHPTSLESPTLIIKNFDIERNYFWFNNSFYWVTDVFALNNELFEIHSEKDVLATYRNEIFNYEAFVNRSDSNFDIMLNDDEMSCRQVIKNIQTKDVPLTPVFDGVGCYILRIVSDSANSVSGIQTFILTHTQVRNILSFMFSDSVFDSAWDSVVKATFNPFQYIVSLKFCAISYSHMTQGCPSEVVKMGWWTSDQSYPVCNYIGDKITFGFNSPTPFFNDFRDYNPNYTRYQLLLPSSGLYEIPSNEMNVESFNFQLYFDVLTGKGTWYMLIADSNALLHKFDANICADVQIAQLSNNINNIVGNIGGAVGSAMSGNVLGVATSISGAIGAILQPSPSSRGSNGSIMEISSITDIAMYVTHMDAIDTHPKGYGRPLNQNIRIGSLSGYARCSGASIELNGHADDSDRVNSYLNSGFYVE